MSDGTGDSGLILPGDNAVPLGPSGSNLVPFARPITSLMTRSQERKMAKALIDSSVETINDLREKITEQARAIAAVAVKIGGTIRITPEMKLAVRQDDRLAFYTDAGTGESVFYVVTPERLAKFNEEQAKELSEMVEPENPPQPSDTFADGEPAQ